MNLVGGGGVNFSTKFRKGNVVPLFSKTSRLIPSRSTVTQSIAVCVRTVNIHFIHDYFLNYRLAGDDRSLVMVTLVTMLQPFGKALCCVTDN